MRSSGGKMRSSGRKMRSSGGQMGSSGTEMGSSEGQMSLSGAEMNASGSEMAPSGGKMSSCSEKGVSGGGEKRPSRPITKNMPCQSVSHISLKIWLDIGTAEGNSPQKTVEDTRMLRDALLAKGWRQDRDLRYLEAEGAGHNEKAWSQRIGPLLEFLFPIDSAR